MIRTVNILEENKTSFTLIRDSESQNQIKYIDIMYYHMKKLVKGKELSME